MAMPNGWTDAFAEAERLKGTHLRTLLKDQARNDSMFVTFGDMTLDYSREKVDTKAMDTLFSLAKTADVEGKKKKMFEGVRINETEGRPVLHVALRSPRDAKIEVDGKNVVPEVWSVLDGMKAFSEKVRSGEWKGYTGKPLTDVVAIGIGGSYLGVEFVFEALKTDPEAASAASGRRLRFLANVDPIDVKRALDGLSAETTLVLVVSKTFTTAETMLNAKTVKEWLIKELGSPDCVAKHVAACSTALDKTAAFGIDSKNVFGFWDWVGGRFSCWSAVGVLPLSLQYGFGIVSKFLEGGHEMDKHFLTAAPQENLPMLMGLLSVWNTSILKYEGCAVLPYCQALTRFVPHIQQLDMESNGKGVTMGGKPVPVGTGAIYFGEPGTNGQHSFYQLMHQGRTIPAEFIGFSASQNPIELPGEAVSNHDELMSNFFAQPDALALGKTAEELKAEKVPDNLIPHKTFTGDRPSLSLLLPICNAYTLGKLLALYEHRTAVQGWVWDINSFDQWGVELGKVLAKQVRGYLSEARKRKADDSGFLKPTSKMMAKYLEK
eukprot:CAMPEP_0206455342 /NCGR_PEP_ID=MMETSP0324_2-20121206/21691_1 /ASSEMBLY_ACC=CAM_ASM_000836 /TAXON_ID=2866 /ORGANISM="Crypthecodinium cohnii, Strain Seligo" /LENGTH=548 /DNA_ID=CAMNT_0053926019 /DNA_START=118 /DNA_END=1764 /DNA_ORIENTATION=+